MKKHTNPTTMADVDALLADIDPIPELDFQMPDLEDLGLGESVIDAAIESALNAPLPTAPRAAARADRLDKSAPKVGVKRSGRAPTSLRIPGWAIDAFRTAAEARGVGYQTLMVERLKDAARTF